ncbi:hypothetical protein KO489_10055 [Reinekea forsetii]|nr:hypothetical protein [Reinekea forsetii]
MNEINMEKSELVSGGMHDRGTDGTGGGWMKGDDAPGGAFYFVEVYVPKRKRRK